MDNRPEGLVVYTVARQKNGEWAVCESGFEKPIATFAMQRDAVSYANGLADTKGEAHVEIDGETA